MAAMYSPKPAQNGDSGFVGRSPSASQQHITMRASTPENIGSPSASRVFEGMLKTSTETGDIGFYSIKPSRISQPIGPPRKIYHPPQHLFRHAQLRNDGRNMASIPQDASSDILSIYDAASQKSVSQSSDVNHPHNRSYSATYSSSTVSNQRSYASLTRPMGDNGYIQRPRSPFAHPSRRPMRPPRACFPALVDGDGPGYLLPPEVDRPLYEHSPGTLSASPVYYPRRQRHPTPSLHYSRNRSTPSLLGQPLPQHGTPSPNLRRSSVPILNRRQHGSGLSPANTSPAGISPTQSNLSLSSAGDLQQDIPPELAQSTPTKSGSGPLYYDYSEGFSPNNYSSPEIPEEPQQPANDKSILDGRQLRVDCIEVEACDDSHQFGNVSPGEFPYTGACQSTDKESRQHSQSGALQGLAATNRQKSFDIGTVDASPNYQYIQPSNLGLGTQLSQVRDDGPSTPVISFSAGPTNSPRIALDDISKKCQSLDRNPMIVGEDCDNGQAFVDTRPSHTFGHENCATNGTHNSVSQLASDFSNDPTNREHSDPQHSPSFLVTDDKLDSDKLEGHIRSGKTIIDAISVSGSRQQAALCSSDQPGEAMTIHSGYPAVMSHALSHKTGIELEGGNSQLKRTIQPVRPRLLPCSSQLQPSDGCKQGQLLQQEVPQNREPPFELDSTANQDRHQCEKEVDFFGTPQAPSERSSYLQISAPPQQNGSPDCSSLSSYEECRQLTLPNLDTDSGNEPTDFDDENLPRFRLKITRPSDSILGTVRVNRASVDSNPFARLNLRDPKDLFTPSPTLDNIFRQPSKHANAPRATANIPYSQGEREFKQVLGSISNQLSGSKPQDSELGCSQFLATTANSLNPTDEQSFFSDDSSHMEGKRNLRKTLSNLRARVAMPYASKHGAHSYDGAHSLDDLSWRDEDFREASPLPAGNAKAVQTTSNVGRFGRLRERIHARRLRKKLSGWFKETRLVIASHVKPGRRSYWNVVGEQGSTARDS